MESFANKLDKVFTKIIEGVTFVGFIAMVLLVFINVVGRYVFHKGIVQAEEISRILFVWLTYLGAVMCFKTNSHVLVDILIMFLHGTTRKIVDLISNLLVSGILVVTFYYSLNLITVNLGNLTPLTKVPLSVVEGIIPASMLMMLVMNLYRMIRILTKKYDLKTLD